MTLRTLCVCTALLACLGACTDKPSRVSSAQTARLQIVVRDTESSPPKTASLACGSKASGEGQLSDAEKAEAACKLVVGNDAAARLLLKGPPADRICTMVYGGPQVARVTGTLRGQIVDRTFKRTNGCEIADWITMAALLGQPAKSSPDAPQ